jgi:hypothetical protein
MDKNMSKKFIELVSEFDGKYLISVDDITTIYQSSEDSELTEVYFGKDEFIRVKTAYDIIANKLFEQ